MPLDELLGVAELCRPELAQHHLPNHRKRETRSRLVREEGQLADQLRATAAAVVADTAAVDTKNDVVVVADVDEMAVVEGGRDRPLGAGPPQNPPF